MARSAPRRSQAAHFSADPAVANTRDPARARQLNRRRADPARPAVHEERLPGLQPSAREDVRPHGEERFRDGGRRDDIEPPRHRQALRGRRDAILGVAAPCDERADLVAHAPIAHLGAPLFDRPRHFEAGNVGRAGRRRISPETLEDVGPIDARGGDLDQHLAVGGDRCGPLRRRPAPRDRRASRISIAIMIPLRTPRRSSPARARSTPAQCRGPGRS